MAESTPRVSAPYLEQFQHVPAVRILGKVTQLRGETATIDANGQITISIPHDAHLTVNHAVEVIGKVQPDLSVKVFQATDFGTGIDFNAVEAVVEATHRHKEIFYGDD